MMPAGITRTTSIMRTRYSCWSRVALATGIMSGPAAALLTLAASPLLGAALALAGPAAHAADP
jgi:hypothetical protein